MKSKKPSKWEQCIEDVHYAIRDETNFQNREDLENVHQYYKEEIMAMVQEGTLHHSQ